MPDDNNWISDVTLRDKVYMKLLNEIVKHHTYGNWKYSTFNSIQHNFSCAERSDADANQILAVQSSEHGHVDFVAQEKI